MRIEKQQEENIVHDSLAWTMQLVFKAKSATMTEKWTHYITYSADTKYTCQYSDFAFWFSNYKLTQQRCKSDDCTIWCDALLKVDLTESELSYCVDNAAHLEA